MTIPAGRPIREALDEMLDKICVENFSKTFPQLSESDRIVLMQRFEQELGRRAHALTRKVQKARAGHML